MIYKIDTKKLNVTRIMALGHVIYELRYGGGRKSLKKTLEVGAMALKAEEDFALRKAKQELLMDVAWAMIVNKWKI